MNSTIPKRHAGTLRNRNVPFQSKKRNGDRNSDRNGIDNYGFHGSASLLQYKSNISILICFIT